MSTSSNHIPLEELIDLAEEREAAQETTALHLKLCTDCSGTLTRLEQTLGLMKTDRAADAPRDVLHRAISVFQVRDQRRSLLRRVMASLTFDSFSLAPAFRTRSSQSEERQLIYSAEGYDIDLHISSTDNKWLIAGQVLGQSCRAGEIAIEGEGVAFSSPLSESCEFKLPVVSAGEYRLRLRLAGIEVEVPRLELRK